MVAAFSVLLPLYIYPSPSSWQPIYNAIASYPSVNFQVIISPNVGPGSGIPDSNYITGISKLNSYNNTQLFGYVYSGYGNRYLSSMESDVSVYQTWNTYTSADIHMDGVFIDGTPSNTQYVSYLQAISQFAKSTLTSGSLVYLNPGRPVDASFYPLADYIGAYEDAEALMNDTTNGIPAIPASLRSQSSVIIHDYTEGTGQQAIDTCTLIAEGFEAGLITDQNGGFNAFSTIWTQYVADVAACLSSSSTTSSSSSSSKATSTSASSTAKTTTTSVSSSVSSATTAASSVNSAALSSASSLSAASASSASAASYEYNIDCVFQQESLTILPGPAQLPQPRVPLHLFRQPLWPGSCSPYFTPIILAFAD